MNKESIYKLTQNYLITYPNDVHALQVLEFLEKYDNFWQRDNSYGHITSSAWVVNEARDTVLMTHHKKLNIWIQLGGHIEARDKSIYDACERELKEESGLSEFKLISEEIFDIDVHKFPQSANGFPEHFHLDIRLLFEANSAEIINFDILESNKVVWLPINEIEKYQNAESVIRMVEKLKFL
ncbi:MAG: NUDIX hydrolase [Chitinophagales bacterium]|nr:NUDIX hydrolase [Chitinophagales bacterium]